MKPFLLSHLLSLLFFFSSSALAQLSCLHLFEAKYSSTTVYDNHLKITRQKVNDGRWDKQELDILFAIRKRITLNEDQLTTFLKPEEIDIVSAIAGRPLSTGKEISLDYYDNLLLQTFTPLAYKLAATKARSNPTVNPEDLRQSALIGIYNAIKSYKPEEGWMFSTVAWRDMLRELDVTLGELHVGASHKRHQIFSRLKAFDAHLRKELNREATIQELIDYNAQKNYKRLSVKTVKDYRDFMAFAKEVSVTFDLSQINRETLEKEFIDIETIDFLKSNERTPEDQYIAKEQIHLFIKTYLDFVNRTKVNVTKSSEMFMAHYGFRVVMENGFYVIQHIDQGMTVKEVAEHFQTTTAQVNKMLHRFRKDLFKYMNQKRMGDMLSALIGIDPFESASNKNQRATFYRAGDIRNESTFVETPKLDDANGFWFKGKYYRYDQVRRR